MQHTSHHMGPGKRLQEPPLLQSTPWTLGWLAAAGVGLGILSLLYAFGNYSWDVFFSYFTHPLIDFLNLLPVVLLLFLLYFLTGRARRAFIITAVIVLGFSFGNYYMLRLRNDPLMFADFLNLREGLAISGKQGYDLAPDRRMWLGIVCVILGAIFLGRFVQKKLGETLRRRLLPVFLTAVLLAFSYLACASNGIYNVYAVNDATNNLAATQAYLSRGFVYPFLHSINANTLKKPEGYKASEARTLLASYQDADIPEEKRVDVVAIQLESFADFSDLDIAGVNWEEAYGAYHELLQESYHGKLLVNIFAGGTVNTERNFLTGFSQLKDFRSDTNSYVWYFDGQGYTVTGSHPSYDWFYNRANINRYLGFPTYYFFENHYQEIAGGSIASDDIFLPEIFKLYQRDVAAGAPIFSFNVTYQGHGPYDTELVWRKEHFTDGRYSTETANIVDNYLGSVKDTAEQLQSLIEDFAQETRPVVVVFYGDHKPWMGDNNSVCTELGISMDTSTEEGLYHKYATEYVIWANDAAKTVTGSDFVGQGPTLSPNYLMNELFALCGWQGNAYMQAMDDLRQDLSAVTTIGRYIYDGQVMTTATLSEEAKKALRTFYVLQYDRETRFEG